MGLVRVATRKTGFNPRSREGATPLAQDPLGPISVSIHAPVKERHQGSSRGTTMPVSIHAPVKERHYVYIQCRGENAFQSTLP